MVFDLIGCMSGQHQPSCSPFTTGRLSHPYYINSCMKDGKLLEYEEVDHEQIYYNTTCNSISDIYFRDLINKSDKAGYTLSIIATILMLVIIVIVRAQVITIHINLLSALIVKCSLWMGWQMWPQENTIVCSTVHFMNIYFIVASHFWLLNETIQIYESFAKIIQEYLNHCFLILGWIVPFIVLLIYASVQYFTDDVNRICWMDYKNSTGFLMGVCFSTIVFSAALMMTSIKFINPKNRPLSTYGKNTAAVRRALIVTVIVLLVFSFNFIMLPIRPLQHGHGERTFEVFSSIFSSLQGLIAAVIIGIGNAGVVALFRSVPNLCFGRDKEIIEMTTVSIRRRNRDRRRRNNVPLSITSLRK